MTNSGKRIAIVYRNLTSLSGTPNTIFSHARYFAGLGYGVDLVAEKVDRARLGGAPVGAVRIRRLPVIKRRRLTWFASRADRRVRSGYDFVAGHGHNAVHDVLSLHNCERLRYLKVQGVEMSRPDPVALFHDRILTEQRFRLCIANSRLMRDELVARYAVPAEKIRVVYPGYDPARFNVEDREVQRGETRRELGVEPDGWLVGVVTSGGFETRGLDLAIDAFASLPASLRERARMVVLGRASRVERYRCQIARHALEGRVTLLPPVRAVERYYHALDIHLHPARFEEFGQTVQEAMACGLPVVTNRQVGAAEMLPDAAYAELPETSTVPVIVAQLERLMRDDEARRAWARYGRQAVEHNSLEANCERTLEVYREAGL